MWNHCNVYRFLNSCTKNIWQYYRHQDFKANVSIFISPLYPVIWLVGTMLLCNGKLFCWIPTYFYFTSFNHKKKFPKFPKYGPYKTFEILSKKNFQRSSALYKIQRIIIILLRNVTNIILSTTFCFISSQGV